MNEVFTQQPGLFRPLPLHILSTGRFSAVSSMVSWQLAPSWTGINWPANNRAIYTPVSLPSRFTVARFLVANDGNNTGNVNLGLYGAGGNLLLQAGSTARGAANAIQYLDVTDQSFPAGHYYLALILSSSTGSVHTAGSTLNVPFVIATGILEEDVGSMTLPNTMTPVRTTAAEFFAYGFTQSATL